MNSSAAVGCTLMEQVFGSPMKYPDAAMAAMGANIGMQHVPIRTSVAKTCFMPVNFTPVDILRISKSA
jgi:hypothetical protein